MESGRTFKLVAASGFVVVVLAGLMASAAVHPTQRLEPPTPPPAAPVLVADTSLRQATELGSAFSAIARAVMPAVVRIEAERTPEVRRRRWLSGGLDELLGNGDSTDVTAPPEIAGGSGFLVASNGYILTNNHVVEDADRITVSLKNKRVFDAQLVGRDPTTDVAVIKIAARDLPALRLGDSDASQVGEWVLAIGNPGFDQGQPLDFTVTSGIISARGRPLGIISRDLRAQFNTPMSNYAIEDFIQTDAAINPGNSGGPLVNLRGEVIGMNTAIASSTGYNQGYGFAIPSNLVRRVMNDLIAYGEVRRALLGVNIADVTEEDAEVYQLPDISGVVIQDLPEESPAAAVGVEPQDVIVAVDDTKVDHMGQLQRLIAVHSPGDVVTLKVIRYGVTKTFQVRLRQAPLAEVPHRLASERRERRSQGIGLEVTELTPALAEQYQFARAGGAVISRVDPLSPAWRKAVAEGWRIVAIDRKPVATAGEARRRLLGLRSGQVVSLLLERPSGSRQVVNIRVP